MYRQIVAAQTDGEAATAHEQLSIWHVVCGTMKTYKLLLLT